MGKVVIPTGDGANIVVVATDASDKDGDNEKNHLVNNENNDNDDNDDNDDGATAEEKETNKCCSVLRFEGNVEAQGYSLMTVARGGIIMSNIFLSTGLIKLASDSAGCLETETECNAQIYGFRPTSLITMIAVVSGVLSAFLLPIIGAIVDYTPHRRMVGVFSALFITVVQGVQIWLTDATWFPMAILQAINGFMYMVQVLAVYAYLPDIGRHVGPTKMTWYSAVFTMCQFSSQATYLIINIGFQFGFKLKDVAAAQVSQGFCVAWLFLTFVPGWNKMPSVPALHPRPSGKSLARIGFGQNWKTVVGIHRHYKSGLRWFFLCVVFAEAGANAFTVVAVTFMVEVLEMTGTQVGIVFLVTLISTIPGSKLGQLIAQKTNPITSWKINLIVFSAVTVAGSFILTGPERQTICYVFGVSWGVLLGWFYPLENVIFTMSVPRGQEAELSGFYTYCRSILTWLPPLVFTVMNESGLHMKWGMLSLVIFLVIGLVLLQLMAPWEDVLEAAKVNRLKEVVFTKPKPSPNSASNDLQQGV
eukprot:CAMPEP_0201633962 /NCGR_PEP_ID=MMETSP0493-20130528/7077_1 /ASSEMBLY_ACC=CAM_ASM_000838 /TAXON_ID=420259 /ORGANISM="Thalassiosira gravida, Strain GMp14c1" /LENGTH=531 /DNA_ID=CAMNT_0048105745 /DNA_START=119 /DNA_END=1714 /DNA_ORIENTATION=+